MTLALRLRHVFSLACGLASLIAVTFPSAAQQLFPADLFPAFNNLGEHEVPPPSKKVPPRQPSRKAQAQPSFDCRRARLPSEKTICKHPDLGALDRQVADAYARQVDAADAMTRPELVAEQRRWIAQRNACGRDEACLADTIGQRLAALSPSRAAAQLDGAPTSPPPSGNFRILQDTDLPYGDYRSGLQDPALREVTLDMCAAQCTIDDRCQSFTYNMKVRVCLLKQEVPVGQTFAGAVSGIKLAGATTGVGAKNGLPADTTADALAGLASPPSGVKPWRFDHIGGRRAMKAGQVLDLFALVRTSWRENRQRPDGIIESLLTKEAYEEVVNVFSTSDWAGRDEFEQADSKRLFETKYLPALVAVTPKAPFVFRFFGSVGLKEYDPKSGAFPLWLGNLPDWLGGSAPSITSDFTPPGELLWHMHEAQARGVLRQLGEKRSVILVADIKVKSVDEATGHIRIGLDTLSIYSPDGYTKLADFPVRNDETPLLSATVPSALTFPAPPPLDETAICAELLSTYGARTPNDVFERCWNDIAERDNAFYASSASTTSLAANDALRPFFPRGGAKLDEHSRAAFMRWFSAYAAGLDVQGVVLPVTSGSYKPGGGLPFWPAPSIYDVKSLLEREGLQIDQLGLTSLYSTPVIFALPNSVMAYATSPPSEDTGATSGALSANVSFRLGKATVETYEDGRPALLLRLTPQSIDISAKGVIIHSHSFGDVPTLSTAFAAGPAKASAQMAAGAVPLDTQLVNLLVAGAADGTLTQEALANMVSQRWLSENDKPPVGNRFFVAGKREPSPEEAAGLGPQFIAWAKTEGPPLPARVKLRQKVTIRKGEDLSWGAFDCFSGNSASLMAAINQTMGINSALGAPKARMDNGTASRQDKLQYTAGQAAFISMELVRPAGAACNMGYVGDGRYFRDAVATIFRFDQGLPAPKIDILGDARDSLLDMTLDITGVTWSATPPGSIDLLTEDMQASLAQLVGPSGAETKAGTEFVTLNVRLVSGEVLDANGQQLATIEPSDPSPLQSLISQYEVQQAEPDTPPPAAATPPPAAPFQMATQAYGPDLAGVRLGMSFEEAETIIRKHMEVGRVLDGKRAFDNEIESGFNVPLTSGKLLVSKDGREFFALIDEPPAADKRVVAAWRRVYVPAETYAPEELFAKIKEKYGQPKIAGEFLGYWYDADPNNCSWILQVNPKPLAETWMDAGQPANFDIPNTSAYSTAGPLIPLRFYDPLGQKPSSCGPVTYAAIFRAQPPFSPMTELNMTLTDLDNYVAAYSASRELLQAHAVKSDASARDGSREIKF